MSSAKLGTQPKALLKLPKEMPSNIVIAILTYYLILLQQIIKPGESKNGQGAPSSGGMVLINDRRDLMSQGGSGQ